MNFQTKLIAYIFLTFFSQNVASQINNTANCTDYLYVNDVDFDVTHKFAIDAIDGSVSEIGNPWSVNPPNNPHGVVQDINGFLYLAEGTSGDIAKLDIEGNVVDIEFIDNDDPTLLAPLRSTNLTSHNGVLYVPLTDRMTIAAFSLCDGSLIGYMNIDNGSNVGLPWDIKSDGVYWYIVGNGSGNNESLFRGLLDPSLFTVPATNSGSELFEFSIGSPRGFTFDSDGNYYVVEDQENNGTSPSPNIVKYDSNGNVLLTIEDSTNGGPNALNGEEGWWGARGIVYSEQSGRLYVGNFENCVTVFDTNLQELVAFNIGNPQNGEPKAIGIVAECCPEPIVADTVYACFQVDTTLFLQSLLGFAGTVAEGGSWSPESANAAAVFDLCDNSVTIDNTETCYTFSLSSDGTGANSQCSAFDIELTVCVESPSFTPTTTQGTCNGTNANNDAIIDLSSVTGDEANVSPGATYTGPAYGDAGNVSISNGSGQLTGLVHNTEYTVRVFSGGNGCFVDETITTPNIVCNASCNLTDTGKTLETCNANGTTSDPVDDYITFNLNPVGSGIGATYSVTADAGGTVTLASGGAATGISYGSATAFRLQNGSADGSTTYTITVTDVDDNTCQVSTTVLQNSCSGACNLTDTGKTLEVCNANGTTSDPADDYITFSLNPVGSGIGATYSVTADAGGTVTSASGGAATGISYGSATAFRLQNGSADGSTTYTITVTDVDDNTCQVSTTVLQSSCSDACQMTGISATAETCNDNGTEPDSADDYISFSLNPAGINVGATYSVTADAGGLVTLASGGAATGISYGAATAFRLQNGSANGTLYTITVTDDGDASCSLTTTLQQSDCAVAVYSLGNRVFYDDDNSGMQDAGEGGVAGVTLQLLNADGSVYDSDTSTTGIQPLTVTTTNEGYYRFDELLEGSYIVEVVASSFSSGAILDTYVSSDGTGEELNPNNDVDLNDNGIDPATSGAVRSGIITLGGVEPLGEQEPASYTAGSFTGAAAADSESNLTVDFGFYRQRDRPDYDDPDRSPCGEEPCHFVSNDIYLGSGVTADSGSQGSSTADADIDDGIALNDRIQLTPGSTIRLPVTFYNVTGQDAYLRGWVDWNGDGDFDDAGEQAADLVYLAAVYTGSFTEYVNISIPVDAQKDNDIATRWRISTDDTNSNDPCGNGSCANDGEIEDYLLRVTCPTALCPVTTINLVRN